MLPLRYAVLAEDVVAVQRDGTAHLLLTDGARVAGLFEVLCRRGSAVRLIVISDPRIEHTNNTSWDEAKGGIAPKPERSRRLQQRAGAGSD